MRLYASLCNGPTIPLSALASYSDTTSALLSSAWPNQTTSKWHAACGRFDRQVLKNSWIKACSFQPFPTARNTRVFCWAWLGLVLQWEEHAMRCTAVWDLQKGGCDHESWEKAQFSFGSVCLFFFQTVTHLQYHFWIEEDLGLSSTGGKTIIAEFRTQEMQSWLGARVRPFKLFLLPFLCTLRCYATIYTT